MKTKLEHLKTVMSARCSNSRLGYMLNFDLTITYIVNDLLFPKCHNLCSTGSDIFVVENLLNQFYTAHQIFYICTHFNPQRVLDHQEDSALLKAYIAEWKKFFTQCTYLPLPFGQLESTLINKASPSSQSKKNQNDESIVRKV